MFLLSKILSKFTSKHKKLHLYCIVLYYIMKPYTDCRLDRYRIGIPWEFSEIRTQPWLSEGS